MNMPRYIVFEGIDGSGKTLQISMLSKRLQRLNYTPIQLAEPTMGGYGYEIRTLMSEGEEIDIDEQNRLFTYDRCEHLRRKIRPLLDLMSSLGADCGFILLQDRSYYSAPAYQASDNNSMLRAIRSQEAFAPKPDVVFVIDVSVDIAMARIGARQKHNDLFEAAKTLERVRRNYHFVAELEENVRIIDGTRSVDEVSDQIWETLLLKRFDPPVQSWNVETNWSN